MNLRITKKLTTIFIAALLFFTFSSRTIHYLLVPKVMAETVVQGSLTEEYDFSSGIGEYFYKREALSIDESLEKPLYIKAVLVNNGEYVKKGDPLITFNTYEYRNEIKMRKIELENLEVEYASVRNDYDTGIKKLSDEAERLQAKIKRLEQGSFNEEAELVSMSGNISDLKDEYEEQVKTVSIKLELYNSGAISLSELKEEQVKGEKLLKDIAEGGKRLEDTLRERLEAYKMEFDETSSQIEFMKGTGIIDHQSVTLVAQRLEEAKKTLAALEKFKDDYQLLSPADGMVRDLKVQINDAYRGMTVLGYVVDTQSEQGLEVKLDKERDLALKKGMDVSINLGGNVVKGQIDQILRENDWYMIVKPETDIIYDFDKITSVSVKIKRSEDNNQLLVPCSSLIQASSPFVFLLKEKKTFFGREYYVQKADIHMVDSNEKYISVSGGITPKDVIVTGWDRELKDGAAVELLAGQGER